MYIARHDLDRSHTRIMNKQNKTKTRGVASYSLSSSPPVSSSASCLLRRIVQPASCANNVTKLADLFAASYSPSNSSSLARHQTRQVLLAIKLVTSCSPSHSSRLHATTLVASRLTRYRPRRRYPHRHRTCRVVLHNFPLSVPLRAPLTMSRSSPIYSPRLTRH